MDIQDTLKELCHARDLASTNYERMEYQNSILQVKLSEGGNTFISELYVDIKYFIKYYILSLEERKHGYDVLNLSKIFDYIENVDEQKRVKLLQYLIRLIKLNGLDEYLSKCTKKLKNTELKYLYKNFKFENIFQIIYKSMIYNMLTIFGSILLTIIITYIVLLPAPSGIKPLIEVKYHSYSSNFYWNHFFNVCSGLINLTEDFKIHPINAGGFFLCLIGKICFWIIIIKILIDEVGKKIKL